MDVLNEPEEDRFSKKTKREAPDAVSKFPGPAIVMKQREADPVDVKIFDNPRMATTPGKCPPPGPPRRFRGVFAKRDMPAGLRKFDSFRASKEVAVDDVPVKQGCYSVSRDNVSSNDQCVRTKVNPTATDTKPFRENLAVVANSRPKVYRDCGEHAGDVPVKQGFYSVSHDIVSSNDQCLRTKVNSTATDTKPLRKNLAVVATSRLKVYRDRGEHAGGEASSMRAKVKEVLRLYWEQLAILAKENERKPKLEKMAYIHKAAAMLLKHQGKWLNSFKRLGAVPGVEIGDRFQFRAELCIIGLHCQFEDGIDYLKDDGIVAASIVESGRYKNVVVSDNVLIYSGCGGNRSVRGEVPLHDQKLKRGNLALKNSMNRGTPVRVIRKEKSGSQPYFFYDGLYLVEKCKQERGQHGKLVFQFRLRRIEGKPVVIEGKQKNCVNLASSNGFCAV